MAFTGYPSGRLTPPAPPRTVEACGGKKGLRRECRECSMAPMAENYVSCPSHCCKNHGCKYDLKGCPVSNGSMEQEFPCEMCTCDLERVDRPYTKGEIGTQVTVAYKREDGELAGLPSDEEALEAIKRALEGLEVKPEWVITFVG